MKNKGVLAAVSLVALVCGGCSDHRPSRLPSRGTAYVSIPENAVGYVPGAIEPGDRLSIQVLGEPDLTSDQYFVDGNGNLEMPLIGEVVAGGRVPEDVRLDITKRLGERYLREPQVAISVAEHQKDSVTVEGDVKQAGRFAATPGLTLLGAVALAQSPLPTAKNDEIYVFRMVGGQRTGARFSLDDIRTGRAADPQIIAGDTIVVGHSFVKQSWLYLLQTAPFFNLFYVFK